MRFLADENCDHCVVRALRVAGHDVRALAEETRRSDDTAVIALADGEQRILLTEDKDFGWLAFVAGAAHAGVILIRYAGSERRALGSAVVDLVAQHGSMLDGAFVVVQPGQVRISPSAATK